MNRVTRNPSGRMNAVTSGPTPTPAAATVAACSTSRLIPRRCVSLPASRMTQRSVVPGASTRKLRFVIPPDNGRSVSSRPSRSGTRCIADTSSSYSSPRRMSSVAGSVSGTASWSATRPPDMNRRRANRVDAPPDCPPSDGLADQRLAGREIAFDVGCPAADRDRVVDGAEHEDRDHQRLEDRPRRHAVDRRAERLDEAVDRRVRDRSPVAAEGSEQRGILPDRDVEQHQAAIQDGDQVDQLAPSTEVEPGGRPGPAAEAGSEDADVAEQIAQVDQTRGSDREREATERTDHEDRNGREDPDRDRGIRRRLERRVDPAPDRAEGQVAVAAHREHHPRRRALDRQGADEDRDEDDEEVDLADGDARPGDVVREGRLDGGRDREAAALTFLHRVRDRGDRKDDGQQEDRADDARDRDGPEDATRRLTPSIDGLLAERPGRVES